MLSVIGEVVYYSFDCIYWDFSSARWRYFIQQNQIQQLPNEDARFDDYPERRRRDDRDEIYAYYEEGQVYRVEKRSSKLSKFKLVPDELLSIFNPNQTPRILEDGDRVVFK